MLHAWRLTLTHPLTGEPPKRMPTVAMARDPIPKDREPQRNTEVRLETTGSPVPPRKARRDSCETRYRRFTEPNSNGGPGPGPRL